MFADPMDMDSKYDNGYRESSIKLLATLNSSK